MGVELNPDQREAAECLVRPVLVSAGAGSGKTRMLTQRFVNAVVPGAIDGWEPVDPDRVLAITFTEKAAAEVAERVRLALFAAQCAEESRRLGDGWISTIHSLCSRLLRRHALDAGIDPLFRVPDTIEDSTLAERSFDEAARTVLESGPEGRQLLDAFSFADLFAATKSITRQLSVAGLSSTDVVLEEPRTTQALIAEAMELFQSGVDGGECGYRGTSGDPADHVERSERALGVCSAIGHDGESESENLQCLLGALREYRPLRSLKGIEDVAAEFCARKEQLTHRVVTAMVQPPARAFLDLVAGYIAVYRDAKAANGLLDFDDLQSAAVKLLERRPDLVAAYRDRFRVVIVDEFQDTDALQLRLVEALSHGNLCTVGDEKQSIYRFRGADIDVYRAHRERMVREGALVCGLHVNYRSHEGILGFVNRFFGSAEYFGGDLDPLVPPEGGREPQPIDEVFEGKPRVEAVFVDGPDRPGRVREAEEIATRLRQLADAGVPPGHMAILVRRYRHAHVYAEALSNVNLAALVVGGSRFFDLPEIATMRSLARSIANAQDSAAVGQLLVSEFVPVSDDALAILRAGETGTDRARSLWDAVRASAPSLADLDREALDRLVEVVDRARTRSGDMPISEVLARAVEDAGYDLRLLSGGNVGRDGFANVLKFLRLADEYGESVGSGLAGFVTYLDTKERLKDTAAPVSVSDDGSDAVRIMSVHASKGLEFPVVVVPDLASTGRGSAPMVQTAPVDGRLRLAIRKPPEEGAKSDLEQSEWFSEFTAAAKEADEQERARQLYVACTRARELLVLSGSRNLRPKTGTKSGDDLVRMARILGLGIPIDGSSDEVLELGGSVRYRRTVIIASEEEEQPSEQSAEATIRTHLPPIPQAFEFESQASALPERLSYTQLMEFEHCPRRFWVRRVLGIRPIETGAGADPLAFGTALHAVLRLVGPDRQPPEAARIEAIARYCQLDGEDTRRLAAAVRTYCDSALAEQVADAKTVRRESPFTLRLGDQGFLLTGAIDVYARSGESAAIVDYKSGTSGSREELQERYRLQADCYALAALVDGCSTVSVEFIRPDFLDATGSPQQVSFAYAADDTPQLETGLLDRFRKMEDSHFAPKPSWAECSRCDVAVPLCPERNRPRARST